MVVGSKRTISLLCNCLKCSFSGLKSKPALCWYCLRHTLTESLKNTPLRWNADYFVRKIFMWEYHISTPLLPVCIVSTANNEYGSSLGGFCCESSPSFVHAHFTAQCNGQTIRGTCYVEFLPSAAWPRQPAWATLDSLQRLSTGQEHARYLDY